MFESPEKNTAPALEKAENYLSGFGGVMVHEDGISYAVTADGESMVPIPTEMADTIKLSLKLQDKIFANPEKYPNLTKKLQVLNCRKSALTAAGVLSVEEATDATTDDLSGVEAMWSDIARLESAGSVAIKLDSIAELESVIDAYEGAFPVIVHIFAGDRESLADKDTFTLTELQTLHREHTFLILGEDETGYVCFQKTGPGLIEPFAISGLDMVVDTRDIPVERQVVVIAGPAA